MIHSSKRIWRLCAVDFPKYRTTTSASNKMKNHDKRENDRKVNVLYEKYKEHILFSSYYESAKVKLGYFKYHLSTTRMAEKKRATEFELKSLEPLPLALQYVVDGDELDHSDEPVTQEEQDKAFQLPLANTIKYEHVSESKPAPPKSKADDVDKWMTDYEHFDDTLLDDVEFSSNFYGTPDPQSRVSRVPCCGCGALLHSSDPSIPGYLPSEIFRGRTDTELFAIECQRCHFLKEYDIALDVSVSPEEYQNLLKSIRHVKSLVVMMVDLLDFPCSIWPGIVDIIGTERPLFIVGNKVDLIPGDSIGYLKRIKESLLLEISKSQLKDANIKHVSLISAKTGYGVEELISMMFKLWLYKGDVFLIGCTNVGKSSLFNALIHSDYCKVHAVDIVKKATVSRWPGTTLNLLKFPINRPSGWKIYQRTQRLNTQKKLLQYENEIRMGQVEERKTPQMPSIMGHIGRTFSDIKRVEEGYSISEWGLNDKLFAKSKWFYDTPGVIHPDQTLSLLTTDELLLTIPKQLLRPQTYYLHAGTTIFIGGLARVDFIDCTEACRFTIFCSNTLPITIVKTHAADELYNEFLGTEMLGVPMSGKERLDNWPGLTKHQDTLEFIGEGPKACCGDIVLSSIAWVSITSKLGSVCKVDAWTPEGRGIHVRKPSLLPYAINLKGVRIRDTPAYKVGNVYVEEKI